MNVTFMEMHFIGILKYCFSEKVRPRPPGCSTSVSSFGGGGVGGVGGVGSGRTSKRTSTSAWLH